VVLGDRRLETDDGTWWQIDRVEWGRRCLAPDQEMDGRQNDSRYGGCRRPHPTRAGTGVSPAQTAVMGEAVRRLLPPWGLHPPPVMVEEPSPPVEEEPTTPVHEEPMAAERD